MDSESKQKPSNWSDRERWIQIGLGALIWGWLMYSDHVRDVDWSALSTPEWLFILGKYTFAGMLITGMKLGEIADFVRAWRGSK